MKSVSAKEVMDKRRKLEGFNNIMFFKLFWTALHMISPMEGTRTRRIISGGVDHCLAHSSHPLKCLHALPWCALLSEL